VAFCPNVLDKENLGKPVTRSSTRKQIHVEETKYETNVQCVAEEVVQVQSPS
jgi:hypothetical protein